MNKHDYVQKMEQMLFDNNTYNIQKRNPLNNIVSEVKTLLKGWKQHDIVSRSSYSRLNALNPVLLRAYGLPKIHKPGYPLRIIVSSTGSPLHNLAAFLHDIIHKSIPESVNFVKNSFHLTNKLSSLTIPEESILMSLDVVSLFTNTPVELVIRSLERRWTNIETNTSLSKTEFIKAVNLVLNSTFFTFNNVVYKQTFGVPMGSPLSPIVADLVLQDLETHSFNLLPFKPDFYFRYVDDVVLATTRSRMDAIVNIFNAYHPRLKFTVEIGGEQINFLDITLIKNRNTILHDWYHKPTFSGRYLNYFSCHPHNQKISTITSLVDKVVSLSHPKFHQKNFDLIINILLTNGYPIEIIFGNIKKRLHKIFFNNKPDDNTIECNNEKTYFTIPYVEGISYKFKYIFKDDPMISMAYTGLNRLSRFIRAQKDKLQQESRSNVVYKINCMDCEASYVGQTGRLLKTRISEYRNHINRNTAQASVITEHRISLSHDFDWNNIEILDEETILNKRLIFEMIFIGKQKQSLNLQTDTDLLDPLYMTLFTGK